MASLYSRMFKVKKKRAVDPNAPPRPTLLGQVKVIKDVRSDIDATKAVVQSTAQQQQAQIDLLRRDLNRAYVRIEMLTNYLRNMK
jgi:uncharacterized protein YaaN involved in tellurite resistance